MTPEEKKELFSKLSECKTEIAGLRRRLNEVDQQKEDHFEKKEKHGNEIKSLINNIKGNGGSMNGVGPVAYGGQIYVPSGYAFAGHMPGNVLIVLKEAVSKKGLQH